MGKLSLSCGCRRQSRSSAVLDRLCSLSSYQTICHCELYTCLKGQVSQYWVRSTLLIAKSDCRIHPQPRFFALKSLTPQAIYGHRFRPKPKNRFSFDIEAKPVKKQTGLFEADRAPMQSNDDDAVPDHQTQPDPTKHRVQAFGHCLYLLQSQRTGH